MTQREIDYTEASCRLSEEIKKQSYREMGGLMIQVFCDAINENETPAMALALAKNVAQPEEAE